MFYRVIHSVLVVGHGVCHGRRLAGSVARHRRVSVGRVLRSVPAGVNRTFAAVAGWVKVVAAVVDDHQILAGHSGGHERVLASAQPVQQLARRSRRLLLLLLLQFQLHLTASAVLRLDRVRAGMLAVGESIVVRLLVNVLRLLLRFG